VNFLKANKRWFTGGLIVLALALLVWYVAPLIGPAGEPHTFDSVLARLLLIGLIVLVWLGIEGLRVLLARRRNRKMVEQLAADNEDASMSREESEALAKRFTDAMTTLRGAKLGAGGGGSGKLLYQLPWYMFIGAPGSGKTTALVNSGLRFPLAASAGSASALGGVGGTRNCDWWFTDEAVLIDTAGRYTTQDSNLNVDQSAWKTFLGLLKKFRPRQPINGIIVTLSIGDLFAFDTTERTRYAQTVRQRVDELQENLGLDFPVYVMVTKCDLIAGFSEFFASFDADQRAQVWGMTFDFDTKTRVAEDAKQGFDARFPALVGKANELLFPRLQEERDTERRAGMYAFPQQFALVGPLISQFLEAAFGASKFSGTAIVRGVYFTSGTQQGAPIDRLVGALTQSLDLSRQRGSALPLGAATGSAKSYFITRLMKEVVFPEARLAGFNEKREQRLTRLSWAATIGVVTLSLLLIGSWLWSYWRNDQALAALQPAVGATAGSLAAIGQPTSNDLPDLAAALDQVRALPNKIAEPVTEPPLGMRWGLYQGISVDDQVAERYRTAVYTGLLPRLALRLEAIMSNPAAEPTLAYAALKTYVMLYEPKHYDADWMRAFTALLWARDYPQASQEALRESLAVHTATLIEGKDLQVAKFHERNETTVKQTRERLASVPLANRAYAFLKAADGAEAPGVRFSEVVGPVGVSIFERTPPKTMAEPIPYLFTREGYEKLVKGQLKAKVASVARDEEWVMGERSSGIGRSDVGTLVSEVQRQYFAEYTTRWEEALNDVHLKKLNGMGDSIDVARKLSQGDSPLRRLIMAANEQTTLTAGAGAAAVGGAASAAATNTAKQAAQNIGSTLGGSLFGSGLGQVGAAAVDAVAAGGKAAPEAQLDVNFERLRRLAGDGKTGELNEALQLITEVYNELIAVDQKVKSGQALADASAGLTRMKASAEKFPPPVAGMIRALTGTGAGAATAAAAKDVKAAMGGAAAMCQKMTAGKYPFVRSAIVDVGVADFANVFKSGGELDSFFATRLAPVVDKSGAAWKFKPTGDVPPPVSNAALAQFQNAEGIRTAFLGGGSTAGVTVDVSVAVADGEVTIDYDGVQSKLKINSGAVRLAWPPAKPGPSIKVSLGPQVVAQADGQWALFRLLDKGALDPGSTGDRMRVMYGGGKVQLDFKATSAAFNPFRLRELNSFACPNEN